jgi:predicted amidohydrolase YtcJ
MLASLTLPLTAQHGPAPTAPDTIFFDGSILTGAHLQPSAPGQAPDPTPARVTALAVRNGTIVATGSDHDILRLKDSHTTLIDLHGAFAMPGFNDAHTHIAAAGQKQLSLDLAGIPSLAAMQSAIRNYLATLPPNPAPAAAEAVPTGLPSAQAAAPSAWILGGGWDQTKWPSRRLPTRQELDEVTAGHPALLYRSDGHIAVANTAALAASDITPDTPDPAGGKFDRNPDGSLTGIVREAPAITLIEAHIPPPSFDTRRKALLLSIQAALANGVTSIQDFSTWDDWLVLEGLEREGRLPLRIAEWIDFNLPVGDLETRRASHNPDDPLLHLTMLKAFMDGSLGSRTAAMNDPYTDDPNNSGIPRYDQQKLDQMSAARAAAGFQLGFHAIGDLANDMALDALEAAEQAGRPAACPALPANPGADIVTSPPCAITPASFRFRIEHAQVVSPGAFQRFHDLGIIASMQPAHLLSDMPWAAARLGPDRSQRAYAWKSFLDHGVTVAFGTDYPFAPINPMLGLYSAVTRMNEAGTQTFEPQEKITLNQAIYAYTQASAFAEFREHSKGRLAPGYLADLVVLDRDITRSTPQQILQTKVLRTIVGGQTVYTANPVHNRA